MEAGFSQAAFTRGYIEDLPFEDGRFDCVISNDAINLSADKPAVFREAARGLRPGGRLALAGIVTERPLTPQIACSPDLCVACIGRKETVTNSSPAAHALRHQNTVL